MKFIVYFDTYHINIDIDASVEKDNRVGDVYLAIISLLNLEEDKVVSMIHDRGILGKDILFSERAYRLAYKPVLYVLLDHHPNSRNKITGTAMLFKEWVDKQSQLCEINADGEYVCGDVNQKKDSLETSEEGSDSDDLDFVVETPAQTASAQTTSAQTTSQPNQRSREIADLTLSLLQSFLSTGTRPTSRPPILRTTASTSVTNNTSTTQRAPSAASLGRPPNPNLINLMNELFSGSSEVEHVSFPTSVPSISSIFNNLNRPDDSHLFASLQTSSSTGPSLLNSQLFPNLASYTVPTMINMGNLSEFMNMLNNLEDVPVTIDAAAVSRLPEFKWANLKDKKSQLSDPTDKCAVCMESFVDNDDVRVLLCKHFFHKKCVDKWLTEHNTTCPLCRTDARTELSQELD